MAQPAPQQYLVWWTAPQAGGIGDRLFGITTTYCIAKISGRKFLIKWDHTNMSHVLTVSDEFNYYKHNPECQIQLLHNNSDVGNYFATTDLTNTWKDKNVLTWGNQNLFLKVSQNPHNKWEIKDYQSMITETFQEVLHKVFVFTPPIQKLLADSTMDYDVGIHIRAGDWQMHDSNQMGRHQDYIIKILSKIKAHLKDPNAKIFITSDCQLVYQLAQKYFKADYVQGPTIHSGNLGPVNDQGIEKVFTDFFTLAKRCKSFYIGINTNFSRVPILYNTDRTVYCFDPVDQSDMKVFSKDELYNYFSMGGKY